VKEVIQDRVASAADLCGMAGVRLIDAPIRSTDGPAGDLDDALEPGAAGGAPPSTSPSACGDERPGQAPHGLPEREEGECTIKWCRLSAVSTTRNARMSERPACRLSSFN
jgi:hypothetical protein